MFNKLSIVFVIMFLFLGCSAKTNEKKQIKTNENKAAKANEKKASKAALVFQSDFGLKDGAVSSMQGVAYGVDPELKIFDLTHEIPAFNIWDGSYNLMMTASYWPKGTVFVSVVDPGVGTDRKSVVMKTKTGHYFVTPDNGTLTLVADKMGVEAVREIDEAVNRLKDSEKSYTFHGRDVYSYTGARLASKTISFEQVGKDLGAKITKIDYQKPVVESGIILGNIPILDKQYGNVWTNISREAFARLNVKFKDTLFIEIFNKKKQVFKGEIPFVKTFGDVEKSKPLVYINSLNNVSLALNWDNFSAAHKVKAGHDWTVKIKKK